MSLPEVQTFTFLSLVFSAQATVYLVREERHFWNSKPGNYLMLASLLDIIIITLMAGFGILMTKVPFKYIFILLAGTFIYMIIVDGKTEIIKKWCQENGIRLILCKNII